MTEKVRQGRENIARAGLSDYVAFLEGDVWDTLAEQPEDVDFALIDDGRWPSHWAAALYWGTVHESSSEGEIAPLLRDALLVSQRISDEISEFSLGEYEMASWETKSAVERQYELLGQALLNVQWADGELADRIPGLVETIMVRDHIAGAVLQPEDETLWRSATESLPQLQQALLHLLAQR